MNVPAHARVVEPGQVWSFLIDVGLGPRRRVWATIVRVEKGWAVAVDPSEHEHRIRVAALRQGKRGARLDGIPKPDPTITLGRIDGPKLKIAVKTVEPHGLQKPIEKYAQALAMQRAGKSNKDIAAFFATTTGNISAWIVKARDAEADAKFRRTG